MRLLPHSPSNRPDGHSLLGPAVRLGAHNPPLEREFDAYTEHFQHVFARADQFSRFRVYLRGLLDGGERKNVGGIAARSIDSGEADVAQALQHFISQSPWDSGRLLASYRRRLGDRLADPGAVWVVHDGVIPKRGLHSVGTQRQYARAVGRKINCQLAVTVTQIGPAGYFPLSARLYLPGYWLREHTDAVAKTVPEGFRRPASKAEIALGLLTDLRSEGLTCPGLIAEEGYETADVVDGLNRHGFPTPLLQNAGEVAFARVLFEWLKSWLGLDHFEGRTWHGWHHHIGLVFTAYGFLAGGRPGPGRPPFPAADA